MFEHKTKTADGFTKRYNIDQLMYYETADNPMGAITREKQLKAGSRKKKIDLINSFNPEWNDLTEQLF